VQASFILESVEFVSFYHSVAHFSLAVKSLPFLRASRYIDRDSAMPTIIGKCTGQLPGEGEASIWLISLLYYSSWSRLAWCWSA
jgi:hypothetical protein